MKAKALSVILILTILLSACSLLSPKTTAALPEGEAVFHFIDVGQGDCTLIQAEDAVILIDAGTSESGSKIIKYIKELGIKYIDCLILTHPHEDHMGGAAAVLSAFDVGELYVNKDTSSSYFYEDFIDEVTKKKIQLQFPEMDCVHEYGDLHIKFLSPKKDYEDENHNSIVTMAQFGETGFLFMADAETVVETDLMEEYDLGADVLKVGHHGSRYASHSAFLNAVLPGICVISCGKDNSYGHPHEETVKRIEALGSTILRTDESGTICLKTDGSKIYATDGKEYSCDIGQAELTYIANKRSKVFHTDICGGLPASQNRVIFKNRQDALDEGYTPCKNCNP